MIMTTPRITYQPTSSHDLQDEEGVYIFTNMKGVRVVADETTALNAIIQKTIIKEATNDAMKALVKRYVMHGDDLVDLEDQRQTIYDGKPVEVPIKKPTYNKQVNPYR